VERVMRGRRTGPPVGRNLLRRGRVEAAQWRIEMRPTLAGGLHDDYIQLG